MTYFRFCGLRTKNRSLEREGVTKQPSLSEKTVEESFSSAARLNVTADSTGSFNPEETDKETKIDLEAAIKAVNAALDGLEIGGKRCSPTPPRPDSASALQQRTSRPSGFPPKAVFPRVVRRFAKFVTPGQRPLQDFNMTQPGMGMSYQPSRVSPTDFLLNSGDMLNSSMNGYFPNGIEMRSNYSEPDMQNALWGSHGNDNWAVQQLNGLINQRGLTPNGVGRHMSADFSNNPQLHKYAMDNAIAEFLNSSGSFSSRIEVPRSGQCDSSSKIEFPVACDSFTSKMSSASVREDSFSSQNPYWNGVNHQPVPDSFLDSAFSIPESIVQELENMAEGDEVRDLPEIIPDDQMDPRSKSEHAILDDTTRTLKSALEGTMCQEDLATDLNYLTISVRRHLMEFQSFSSVAAEKFLIVGGTLPVVCKTAIFNDHIISLLKRFMDIVSSGHPMLNNAAVCVTPATTTDLQKQSEARHLLSRVNRSLNSSIDNEPIQPMSFTSFDSSDEGQSLKTSSPESVHRSTLSEIAGHSVI